VSSTIAMAHGSEILILGHFFEYRIGIGPIRAAAIRVSIVSREHIADLRERFYPRTMRVPGLPIRDCAGSYNSSIQMYTSLNATDVTEKAIFERLYLVSVRRTFAFS